MYGAGVSTPGTQGPSRCKMELRVGRGEGGKGIGTSRALELGSPKIPRILNLNLACMLF